MRRAVESISAGGGTEAPGEDADVFLAVAHGDDADFKSADGGEGLLEFGQAGAFGDEGGEPAAESGAGGALGDHATEEGGFAAGAPEFVGLAAEVEGGLAGGAVTAAGGKVAKFAGGAGGGLGGGGVEGRVAERGGEGFSEVDYVGENGGGVGLMAQLNQGGEGDWLCRCGHG